MLNCSMHGHDKVPCHRYTMVIAYDGLSAKGGLLRGIHFAIPA